MKDSEIAFVVVLAFGIGIIGSLFIVTSGDFEPSATTEFYLPLELTFYDKDTGVRFHENFSCQIKDRNGFLLEIVTIIDGKGLTKEKFWSSYAYVGFPPTTIQLYESQQITVVTLGYAWDRNIPFAKQGDERYYLSFFVTTRLPDRVIE